MNCIIPGLNLKVVAKALHALAKVGDEVFVEAKKEKLTLITLNSRKTVCVQYHLLDSFFSSYEVNENEFNEQNEAVTCKIHMKILLSLLKGTHLEKKLDFIKLEYENNSDILYFKMKYKCDDIIMVHKLRLMEPESLTIQISSDSGCNNIVAPSSLFNQLLTMFSNSDDEITLEISKGKVIARNYVVDAPVRPKCVRSQVNLNASEFNVFQISNETNINFSLKPFRTAVQFAEGFNLNIGLNFETGGRPLAIVVKNPTFEANFIVASLNPYSDAQSSMATTSIPTKITQINNHNMNITAEDQEALLQENWDDFNMEEPPNKPSKDKTTKNTFQEIMNKVKRKNKNPANSRNGLEDKQKKGNKKFNLLMEDQPLEVNEELNDLDVLPPSPESPRTKKAKLVFGRCFEPTFTETYLGGVLVPNSDSE